MRRKTIIWIGLSLILSMAACQSAHNVHHGYLMKGSIVDKSTDGVVICIGTRDGAKVGQELYVSHVAQGNPKGTYTKQRVGVVKITQIIDEHFAKASVSSGRAEMGHIVELE